MVHRRRNTSKSEILHNKEHLWRQFIWKHFTFLCLKLSQISFSALFPVCFLGWKNRVTIALLSISLWVPTWPIPFLKSSQWGGSLKKHRKLATVMHDSPTTNNLQQTSPRKKLKWETMIKTVLCIRLLGLLLDMLSRCPRGWKTFSM